MPLVSISVTAVSHAPPLLGPKAASLVLLARCLGLGLFARCLELGLLARCLEVNLAPREHCHVLRRLALGTGASVLRGMRFRAVLC